MGGAYILRGSGNQLYLRLPDRPHPERERRYGQSFDGRPAQISCTAAFIQYWRSDFLIVVSRDYSEATIEAYDLLALNQALLTLYSALITYRDWGLLVRATCWIEDGRVLMSADTSSPRPFMTNEKPFAHTLLSDEAALIKVSGDHLRAFNSLSAAVRCEIRLKSI